MLITGPRHLRTAVDVFDSQERAYTQQLTAKGYDTMTGVGAPILPPSGSGLSARALPP
jgi:hypothetical protein